jgi:hypothetical protein
VLVAIEVLRGTRQQSQGVKSLILLAFCAALVDAAPRRSPHHRLLAARAMQRL